MDFVSLEELGGISRVTLRRGKVNALSEQAIDQLTSVFGELESDSSRAVILEGSGKFFSFGFDVPELLSYPKQDFIRYLTKFTGLYTRLFVFPKPLVAALNGHTIAGGCMIAIACDQRIMAAGRISLNEITFGASVFAGSVEMLRSCVGDRNAAAVLYSGAMYTPEEALRLGLVDSVVAETELPVRAEAVARELASRDPRVFASMKRLLRGSVAERMRSRERASIEEFAEIWYSEATWAQLQRIAIRG